MVQQEKIYKNPERFTKNERFVIETMKKLGAGMKKAVVPIRLLQKDAESAEENTYSLRAYIEFQGKYATCENILAKSAQLARKREEYTPCEMYAKYIGESAANLLRNKIYKVEKVLGADELYLLYDEDGTLFEADAAAFELQKVTEFLRFGTKVAEGEEKVYKVTEAKKGQYLCENGETYLPEEGEPCGFEKAEPPLPEPFKNTKAALLLLMKAFDFGEVRAFAKHLHPECEYISRPGRKEFHTRAEIVGHLVRVAKAQLEDDFFMDSVLSVVSEAEEGNRFSVGERCLAMYARNGCKDLAFVRLSEDRRYIMGIYVLDEPYSFVWGDRSDMNDEMKNQKFVKAADAKSLSEMRRWISRGANPNTVDKFGENAFAEAFAFACEREAEHESDREEVLYEAETLLRAAVRHGWRTKEYGLAAMRDLVFNSDLRLSFSLAKLFLEFNLGNDDERYEKLLEAIGTEESYRRCCDNDHEGENVLYAMYEAVEAKMDGRTYEGIDVFHKAVGRQIDRILYFDESRPVYEGGTTEYESDIGLVCDGRLLIIKSGAHILFMDGREKETHMETPDLFGENTLGATITDIAFSHKEIKKGNTYYGQPTIILSLDTGKKIKFTHDFGENGDEPVHSYFVVEA